MANEFSYFKPKRNNSKFKFRTDKNTFSDKGIYIEGQDGFVDQRLLFDKLIEASHYVAEKTEVLNDSLLNSNSIIIINTPKEIEDFYYKDFIEKPSYWKIPDKDLFTVSSDADATRVDQSQLTGSTLKEHKKFKVVFNRRTGGDIYTRPSFSGQIDIQNERAIYVLKFPYTTEGATESKQEDGLDPFLPTYTTSEFDSEDGFDSKTRKKKSLALYIESQSFYHFLRLASDIYTGKGEKDEVFISDRFDYYSYLFAQVYDRNKLASTSKGDLKLLRNFYGIIPDGCYREIGDEQMTYDLGKFLANDKDSIFTDESNMILTILKNVNDLENVYTDKVLMSKNFTITSVMITRMKNILISFGCSLCYIKSR